MTKSEYQKQYYQKNAEKLMAYRKAYYAKNRETMLAKRNKTGSRNKKWTLDELEAKFGPRPNCCNPGCGKPSLCNGHRWSMFCSHCRLVSQGKKDAKPGITYLRKNSCANADGRANLGFPCFTNWDLVKQHQAKITTHMDHVDGNHLNNDPNNLMELCPYCHDEKGRQNGDKNGWKNKLKTEKNA